MVKASATVTITRPDTLTEEGESSTRKRRVKWLEPRAIRLEDVKRPVEAVRTALVPSVKPVTREREKSDPIVMFTA
jgi:hypothetical protein